MKKILHAFFMIAFAIFFIHAYAGITTDENKQLANFLQSHNTIPVKTGLEFYQAGQICYKNQLQSVIYFSTSSTIFFWLNDKQGKCHLAGLYLGQTPPEIKTAKTCTIDASMQQSLFQPWYLDALKQQPNNSETVQSPVLMELFGKIGACLEQQSFSFANLMELLNTAK